jgi:DNA-directed RNA polymerase subunit RPC12/RpoP
MTAHTPPVLEPEQEEGIWYAPNGKAMITITTYGYNDEVIMRSRALIVKPVFGDGPVHSIELNVPVAEVAAEPAIREGRKGARKRKKPDTNREGRLRHACDVCEYRTAHESSLTKHQRTHTGEKPYACTHCSYRTGTKGSLTRHQRTHTGEQPYACTHCSYRATTKGNLTVHQRTHTGEKPYACTHCSYRATQKSSLTSHHRRHH